MGSIRLQVGNESVDVPDDISDEEMAALKQKGFHGFGGNEEPQDISVGSAAAKTGQEALETFGPMVGGVGGSLAGGAVGGPVGAVVGGAAGAGLGEMAPALRPYTTGEEAPSFSQIGVEAGKTGLFSILTDLVTRGILSPAGKWVGRKMTHVDEPLPAGAAAVQGELEKRGTSLTAAQMENLRAEESPRFVRTAEEIAYQSVLSRRVNRTYADQAAAANDILDEMSARVAHMQPSDVSKLITNEVDYQFENIVRPVRDKLYEKAYNAMPGPVVSTSAIKRELATFGNKEHWKPVLAAMGDDANAALTTMDPSGKFALDRISLKQAVTMRASLNSLANKTDDDAVRRTAKKMVAQLNTAIDGAVPKAPKNLAGGALTAFNTKAQQTAADARKALDDADAYFGETNDMFKNELIRKTMDKLSQEPGKLESTLLSSNSVDTLKAVENAMGPKIFAKDIQPRLRAAFIAGSQDNFGHLQPGQLFNRLKNLGEESGKAAFGDEGYKELKLLVDMMEANKTRPGGKLGVAVNLTQFSAVGAVIALSPSTAPAKAAQTLMVTLTPWALGHMVADPKLINAFRRGLFMSSAAGHEVPFFRETMKKLAAVSTAHNTPFNVGPSSSFNRSDLLQPDEPGAAPIVKPTALPNKLDRSGRPQAVLEQAG